MFLTLVMYAWPHLEGPRAAWLPAQHLLQPGSLLHGSDLGPHLPLGALGGASRDLGLLSGLDRPAQAVQALLELLPEGGVPRAAGRRRRERAACYFHLIVQLAGCIRSREPSLQNIFGCLNVSLQDKAAAGSVKLATLHVRVRWAA